MENSWLSIRQFLFEKDSEDNSERFKTYLSPYLVPKAYRIGSDNQAKAIIEFKYVDVNEPTRKVTHPENHRIYFEIGEKTKRVYKVFFYDALACSEESLSVSGHDLDKAFENLSAKLTGLSMDKYVATLAAAKQCLSSINAA